MKRFLVLLIVLFLLVGCSAPNNTTAPSTDPSGSSTQGDPARSVTDSTGATTTTDATQSTDATDATDPTNADSTTAPQPVTFYLYICNETLDGFEELEMTIEALRPELIVQLLIEHGVLNENVQVNAASVEENMLYLDLNEAFLMQIYTLGTTGEAMLMGSLVNTFLSAYGCESMMVTVDDDIIHSGHVDYDFPLTRFP